MTHKAESPIVCPQKSDFLSPSYHQNINQLLTQARIRPYLKDGKPDGFILSYIKADSFFTQLGLQRGDIVKSINSKPINTPEDAFSFYKAVESGDPLSMEIVRGGQPRTINYQFK